ncbi:conserved hypothetical protein [Vibrio phage 275E43-1]|nr:conserved hypothetical protein [Vibrio phage 275E43-1]
MAKGNNRLRREFYIKALKGEVPAQLGAPRTDPVVDIEALQQLEEEHFRKIVAGQLPSKEA